MEIFPPFYKQILKAFEDQTLRYMIVGGYASTFHGVIRSTFDLDLWVDNTTNNLEKLYQSFLYLNYNEEDSEQAIEAFKNNHMIKLPDENDLVEIMDDAVCRLDFDKAYARRTEQRTNDLKYHIISLDDLIQMKSGSNRYRDLSDAEELKKFRDGKHDEA
jgi:hypothetical protein